MASSLPTVASSPAHEPIDDDDEDYDAVDCGDVVHICDHISVSHKYTPSHRLHGRESESVERVRHTISDHRSNWRERVHDQRKARPQQQHTIRHQPHRPQPERTMADIVSPADEQAYNRNGVADVEQHDAGGDHAVEGGVGAEIEQAEKRDDEAGYEMCAEGDLNASIHMAEKFAEWQAAVPGEGPAEAGLPGVACDETPDACCHEQGF